MLSCRHRPRTSSTAQRVHTRVLLLLLLTVGTARVLAHNGCDLIDQDERNALVGIRRAF
jgi:hypothetical protein